MPVRASRLRRAVATHLRDPVYANGHALVANSVLAAALGFVFWVVAARLFPPEALGWGAAVVSAATLAALLGKAGFDAAVVRYAPSARPRVLRKLVLYALAASVGLTLGACAVVLVLAGGGLGSLAPLRTPLAAIGFAALAAGTAAAWILDAVFIAKQRALFTLARNATFNVVKVGVPFAIAASLVAYAVPIAWAVGLAASLVVSVAALPRVLARHDARGESPARREVAAYSGKTFALNVSEFLPGLVLPILVLEMLGAAENARFFLAWTIATVGFLASKAVGQSAFAQLVRPGDAAESVRKGFVLSALVLAPFVAGALLLAGLMPTLFGAHYAGEPETLLRILALSIVPLVAFNLFLSYLKARQAAWELTLLPVATLVAVLALAPLALQWGGMIALGLLWLAVQATAGAYAATRLLVTLRRNLHDHTDAHLRRRAHEG